MIIDIKHDDDLLRAREELRLVNVDLKIGDVDGHPVVIAFQLEGGTAAPIRGVAPLPYPSARLPQWAAEVATHVSGSASGVAYSGDHLR